MTTEATIRESCGYDCNPYAIRPVCAVCNDIRFVCTRPTARRYVGGNSASEVFPCPACGQHIVDGDGKKYGTPGRRYGNPFLSTDYDYFKWRERNREKQHKWQDALIFASELRQQKHLQQTYPAADPRWVRCWVLGERKVFNEGNNEAP